MPVTRRQRRISELLKEELSILLLQEARDPRLADVTVTDVEISPDLRHARVYVSLMADEQAKRKALKGLERATGFLKRELAARVALRRIPDLTFHLDESMERGQRIMELLHQIEGEMGGTVDLSADEEEEQASHG